MRPVEDHEEAMRICRMLSLKFTDDHTYIEEEIRRSGPGTVVWRLTPVHMTGKWVEES